MNETYKHYAEFDAQITQGGAGTTEVVAAVEGFRIRVVGYAFTLSAAGTARFYSGANPKTGAMTLAANGGVAVADVPFMCSEGEALQITSTVGAANGHVAYQLIPA